MFSGNIGGCDCCGGGTDPPDPPGPYDPRTICAGCESFDFPDWSEVPEPERPVGAILSRNQSLYGEIFWDMTPFQNIAESYPLYRCGFWEIVPNNLRGCIDPVGNLVGLPESICFINETYRVYGDSFLQISAPNRLEGASNPPIVSPYRWPAAPLDMANATVSHEAFEFLQAVNIARSNPASFYNQTIQSETPFVAYCENVTSALLAWKVNATQLRNYWTIAESLPLVKIDKDLSHVAQEHANTIAREHTHRYPSAGERAVYADYLNANYSGTFDLDGVCVFAAGEGGASPGPDCTTNQTVSCSAMGFTAQAFLLSWGVPTAWQRNILRDGSATDIGIGVAYNQGTSGYGPWYTVYLTGARS